MKENIVEFYYEKLAKTARPGGIITTFYGELFDIQPKRKEIIMFNKLVKIYGRYVVFFSVLDLTNIRKLDHTNLYGLLHTICRNRFERSHSVSPSPSFRKINIKKLRSEIDSVLSEKLDIPDSKELG